VRIEAGGKAFVYSGDLNTTPGFELFAAGADMLLIDGCFTQSEWNEDLPHLSAGLAAGIGAAAGVKRLLLTHIRPASNEAALLREAGRAFHGAETAREGARYEF
jgi:ribonuclease BN (tRNA processing enzyme)